MGSQLVQVKARVAELEGLATEIAALAEKKFAGTPVQPGFSVKGQQWYRGARELLASNGFSGLVDFEDCYTGMHERLGKKMRMFTDIERTITGADGATVDPTIVACLKCYSRRQDRLCLHSSLN